MAASDATWPPKKNATWRVTFPVLDADGDLVSAMDTPDSEISKDGGAFADCTNEATEIGATGIYYLDITDSEMNADTVAIIVKSATSGMKTTPIVVYPQSGDFTDIDTDIATIDTALDSDILALETAIDSDFLALETALDSDQVIISDAILVLDTALDSDILALETAIDSDILALETALDSDQVIISDAILALSTKVDSDAVLADADHDKTQSDILLLDGLIDSDILALETALDSDQVIISDAILALSTKADSDAVLADADHDKTQSDVALGVQLAATQAQTWASALEASAATIVEATVDTVTNAHAPTTTEFQADDVTEATADHFNGRIVVFTSGNLQYQATDITDYEAVGGIGQFTVTAMTEAPANNDTFVIV